MLIGIELSDIVDVYQGLSLVWNWKSSKPLGTGLNENKVGPKNSTGGSLPKWFCQVSK